MSVEIIHQYQYFNRHTNPTELCHTLTRDDIVILENDLTLNYEVGEEVEGGITLPDFKIWMNELRDGQHQEDDVQAQLHYGQCEGGLKEGAVRKAVRRIGSGKNFKGVRKLET